MSAPDPEGFSLLSKVLAAGVAVIAPVAGAYKFLDHRLGKKADKDVVARALDKIEEEFTIHRGYFKDVFDKITDAEHTAEARHRELLMHMLEKKP